MDGIITPIAVAGPATPRPVPQAGERWMGIYLGASKVGYVQEQTVPEGSGSQTRYRQHTTTSLRTALLGIPMEVRVDADQLMDASLRPVRIDARIESAGVRVAVEAQFYGDRVEVCRRTGGASVRQSLPIPEGATLIADGEVPLLYRDVQVGHTWRYTFLNIFTLALEEATVRVVGRERVTLGQETFDTLVTQTQAATFHSTSWLLADGQPVKMMVAPGLTMVRETREEALSGLERRPDSPGPDLALQTAVPVRGIVLNPGRVRFLRVRITGVPGEQFVLSDSRQRAQVVDRGQALTVEYTVDAEASAAAPDLPGADRAALLRAEAYLEVDHPEIVERARQVTAGAGDDRARVEALWQWVYTNVVWQGNIGMPRTALDVLRHRVGVCRDKATLYAALARAAGVPTRLCAGIVYSGGSFLYHAWAESWVTDRWVPVDATVAPPFVDATRIKFAQGDAAAMYGAAPIIGRLAAEILEQR